MSTVQTVGIVLLVFLFLVYRVECEVSLRVFLRPPIVTLECLIINFVSKASTIMMCPNDQMCFQNCRRLCNDDCVTNVIKCTEENVSNGIKYTYTFDSSNLRNQGEWSCHFGDQQSSTVIFLNKTEEKSTTVLTTKTSTTTLPFFSTSKIQVSNASKQKERALVNETYVIILLALLSISFGLNILLISRGVIHNLSAKKLMIPNNCKEKSSFLKLCNKLLCVEVIEIKNKNQKHFCYDDNQILPRQLSSNIYECTGSSQVQPAILLDNYAFTGTPSNQRMFPSNIYSRSQSFPAKSMDSTLHNSFEPNKSFKVNSQFNNMNSKPESFGQIIYDDVADPSLTYMPLNFFNQIGAYYRPSQYISINPNYHQNCPTTTMSMNNLAVTSCRITDANVNCENTNDDSILKDAINSRVELSKEMINQADTLLKRADTLLNDKDPQKPNNKPLQ